MTKTLQLDLQKRILIVETDNEKQLSENVEFFKMVKISALEQHLVELICKGSELTEEILTPFLEFFVFDQLIDNRNYSGNVYKDYRDNGYLSEALDSFISAIESKGWYWKDNPEKKSHFNPEEFIQEEYERFMETESKTFHPDRVLIFEILNP